MKQARHCGTIDSRAGEKGLATHTLRILYVTSLPRTIHVTSNSARVHSQHKLQERFELKSV